MNPIWIIFIGISLLSWIVQANLNSKFKKFSEIPVGGGMTGRDVAEKMLRDHGIYDVKVTCVEGHLTDHYNPANHTVNLSRDVYSSCSVAAGRWQPTSVAMPCSMPRPMVPCVCARRSSP